MKKIAILLGVSLLAIMILSFRSYAETEEYAVITDQAIILDLGGDVEVRLKPSAVWRKAEVGMVISKSAKIRTGVDSWAEVGFEIGYGNDNVIRIQGETNVTFSEIAPVRLGLLKGELRSLVQGLSMGSSFEIETPTAVCGARGTGWDTATDGKKVTIDAYEEEVYFKPKSDGGDEGADSKIKAGKRCVMSGPKEPVKIVDLPPGKMGEWNRWKVDMSKRTGIKVGLRGQVADLKKKNKIIQDIIKGKQKMLEKKDLESIRGRLDRKGGSSDYQE